MGIAKDVQPIGGLSSDPCGVERDYPACARLIAGENKRNLAVSCIEHQQRILIGNRLIASVAFIEHRARQVDAQAAGKRLIPFIIIHLLTEKIELDHVLDARSPDRAPLKEVLATENGMLFAEVDEPLYERQE